MTAPIESVAVRERAEKGKAFLEGLGYDLCKDIDLDFLNMADDNCCVLGQISGDGRYYIKLGRLIDRLAEDVDADEWAFENGFGGPPDLVFTRHSSSYSSPSLRIYFDDLEVQWRDLLDD